MASPEEARGTGIDSVIISVDGESKCGKTTMIDTVLREYRTITDSDEQLAAMRADGDPEGTSPYTAQIFADAEVISCGNAFRAAALYKAIAEIELGEVIDEWDPETHTVPVMEILAIDGITGVLQNDEGIADTVSTVGAMPGVQGLAGSIFREDVKRAYRNEGEHGNLVIVDARDPVAWLTREDGLVGTGDEQIDPRAILPLYLDTTAETAASRLEGGVEANLATIERRRGQDRDREEYPVVRPEKLLDREQWSRIVDDLTRTDLLHPLEVDNNRATIAELQNLGAYLAFKALNTGRALHILKNAS